MKRYQLSARLSERGVERAILSPNPEASLWAGISVIKCFNICQRRGGGGV